MSEKFSFRPVRRPNVIWVFGDQHRAHALSYRGDPNVFTPNIDNLAARGDAFLTVRFPVRRGVRLFAARS